MLKEPEGLLIAMERGKNPVENWNSDVTVYM